MRLTPYIALMLMLTMDVFSNVSAQPRPGNPHDKKSALFAHLPAQFPTDSLRLEQLFSNHPNDTVSLLHPNNPVFRAIIREKMQYSDGRISMNLDIIKFPGAMLNLSRTFNPDSSIVFRGRILHPYYSDLYTLINKGKQYALVRQGVRKHLLE